MYQFPIVAGYFWREVKFSKISKIYSERTKYVLGLIVFFLPSIISRFRMQSIFDVLFIRHNSELLLSSSLLGNATVTIGGDPGGTGGGGGTCPPPSNFSGGIVPPPSIFESLKNIYSYICILNTMKVIQSV